MIKRSSEKTFPEEDPEFQVAPMIDILLVLMTFFMSITSTEILKTKTKLTLELAVAKESKPKKDKVAEVIVNVGWNSNLKKGWIEIAEKSVDEPSKVTDIVMRVKGTRKEFFRALIRAGENVPYSYTQQVLSACADADVDNITFPVLSQDAPHNYGVNSEETRKKAQAQGK